MPKVLNHQSRLNEAVAPCRRNLQEYASYRLPLLHHTHLRVPNYHLRLLLRVGKAKVDMSNLESVCCVVQLF